MPKKVTKKTTPKKSSKKHCRITARRKSTGGSARKQFMVNISLVAVLFVGLVSFLITASHQATMGFTLNTLDRERAAAFDDVERTERVVREMQSVHYITQKAQELGMVEAQTLVHLQADTGVAVNR